MNNENKKLTNKCWWNPANFTKETARDFDDIGGINLEDDFYETLIMKSNRSEHILSSMLSSFDVIDVKWWKALWNLLT